MSSEGPNVAVLESFSPSVVASLERWLPSGSKVSIGTEELSTADFIITWMVDLDSELLAAAKGARGVVKLESGSGTIDEGACELLGIVVGRARSPALVSVAEHTVMLILACFKNLITAIDLTRHRRPTAESESVLTDQDNYSYNWVDLDRFEAIQGKTIGLVGLGKIGASVAKQLSGFDVDIVYTKRNKLASDEEKALGVRYLSFEELLPASHCVSLHNRFTSDTELMMGEREFSAMPRGSFFVNTARGRLVDEKALVAALESGHLAAAALDVFWHEPPPPDSPLWATPNLLMTPHSAGIPIDIALVEEMRHAGRFIADQWQSSGQKGSEE